MTAAGYPAKDCAIGGASVSILPDGRLRRMVINIEAEQCEIVAAELEDLAEQLRGFARRQRGKAAKVTPIR